MEVERKMIVVCCIVGFLGLLSAATGFAAEAKRIKVYVDLINSYGRRIVINGALIIHSIKLFCFVCI